MEERGEEEEAAAVVVEDEERIVVSSSSVTTAASIWSTSISRASKAEVSVGGKEKNREEEKVPKRKMDKWNKKTVQKNNKNRELKIK